MPDTASLRAGRLSAGVESRRREKNAEPHGYRARILTSTHPARMGS
jgi:hypothetical protein